ncbi:sulfite exporter TauE/SafE family protein [Alphaproteobacteria bacterium]|nr:sulfite exporter TauE/SafE family protein [Alphaproteobacteria bacterium]
MNELVSLLPPAMPLLDAGLLVAASLVTSFISAAFGIGGGFTLIALLALLLPPAALIPVHGIVQLGSNAGRVGIMLKKVVWRPILPFVIGTVIGAGLGAMVVVQLPPWAVQLALGIFIIWVVFAKLPPIQQRYILLGGLVSSFLTMFFGATGNFIAAMVKSMNLDPVPHVATHSLMMTFQHFVKVLIFGLIGFQFGPYMILIIGMLISGFIGTVIGSRFLTKAGGRYFKPVLNAILFLAAARLIWAGFEGLLAL